MIVPLAPSFPHSFNAERPQWGLWLPVFLGVGIGLYFQLPKEPSPWFAPTIIAACTGLYLITRRAVGAVLWIAVGTIFFGMAAADFRTEILHTPDIAVPRGSTTITGVLLENDQRMSRSRLIIRTTSSNSIAPGLRVRISVTGHDNGTERLFIGDTVRFRTIMRVPPPPVMPGAFDLQRHAYFQGIDAFGFAISPIEILSQRSNRNIWVEIDQLRYSITGHILRSQPNQSGAVATALLTGHRGHLNDETLQVMRDSGIAHLLAISGLHIGLVAGLVFAVVRFLIALIQRFSLYWNGKKIAACVALTAALSYAILAGFTVPTQRAFVMSALVLIAVVLNRRAISLRGVAIAASAILLARPESLLQPGFQMSFAAVTALVSAHVTYASWRRQRHATAIQTNHATRFIKYLGGVMAVSLIAGLATAPFAIYHFQHVAAFGMIANLLAVPIAAFWVIPAGMLTLFSMTVGMENMPLIVMCTGIDLILVITNWTAALPAAALDVAAISRIAMILITFGALWLAIWQRNWRLWGIPIIAAGVWSSLHHPVPDIIVDGEARLVSVREGLDRQYLSSRRRARFAAEIWARRSGLSGSADLLQMTGSSAQHGVGCDSTGCILNRSGKRIAIAFEHSALIDDCAKSDLVIALVPVHRFCSARRIDRFDLWRNGTHAVYVNETDIKVKSVNGFRGTRPWTRNPARK